VKIKLPEANESQEGSVEKYSSSFRSTTPSSINPELLTEIKGTLAIEGIAISNERLMEFAAEYESAKERGVIDELLERARAKFPEK
jgi:hypothetical protein